MANLHDGLEFDFKMFTSIDKLWDERISRNEISSGGLFTDRDEIIISIAFPLGLEFFSSYKIYFYKEDFFRYVHMVCHFRS
jgi:hypothetical protein